MKRGEPDNPYLTKRQVCDAMTDLIAENDSAGSRYESAYDDLREELGIKKFSDADSGDDDDNGSDKDKDSKKKSPQARHWGGFV